MEVDVSNDKQLIEVAKIVQRLEAAYARSSEEVGGGSSQLSSAEKDQLRGLVNDFKQEKDEDLERLKEEKTKALDELNEDDE